MSLKLLHDGLIILPRDEEERSLSLFCQENKLEITLEWMKGQYWLHSDLEKERPIGIEIDSELKRHEEYFRRSSVQKELLAKAIGLKGPYRPKILDLTAGLIGDTLLFLSFGCEVISLERHPVIALLIRSAIKNAKHPALSRLTFHSEDAVCFLKNPATTDVIYFDPMFEDANEKASPRKEMRIFRTLIGSDLDALKVFGVAKEHNPKRLVVKRPRLSKALDENNLLKYEGKATRYDVYLGQNTRTFDSNPLK